MWESNSSFFYQRATDGSLFQTPWRVEAEKIMANTLFVEWETGRAFSYANPETVISYTLSLPGGAIGTASYFNQDNTMLWEVSTWSNVSSRAINLSNRARQPFSFHPGSANIAFADGSIRSMSEGIDARVFMSLVTLMDDQMIASVE
jgi:prepilin-type processing-associated H-X9-DG protein